jgi:16S rRNA (cytosine967-C5)-methyltransferase
LVRVAKDRAFAAAALDAELSRAVQLDARDRALATEIVYGALRVHPWLEERIGRHAPRGARSIDAHVLAHLVVAAYQLFFLSRVPAFAAVSEAVSSISKLRGKRVGAFANAVLRRLAEEAKDMTDAERRAAVVGSVPGWLRASLERALGPADAAAFVESALAPPSLALRVEDPGARGEWLARLREHPGTFELGRVSPLAIVAKGAGTPRALPGVADGHLSIQEEGSQVVALALGARPGERVLDACAGRGNKTAILARAVRPGGSVDAADAYPSKLARLAAELDRLGLPRVRTFAVDWTAGTGEARPSVARGEPDERRPYDRILVDAPCTGVGTLRRRPDLELRRVESDVSRLAAIQRAIVCSVAALLAPGGRLVYAVCSVLREEGEDVVHEVLASCKELELAPFEAEVARRLAAARPGSPEMLRLLPHVHGTDGYFLASLRRR